LVPEERPDPVAAGTGGKEEKKKETKILPPVEEEKETMGRIGHTVKDLGTRPLLGLRGKRKEEKRKRKRPHLSHNIAIDETNNGGECRFGQLGTKERKKKECNPNFVRRGKKRKRGVKKGFFVNRIVPPKMKGVCATRGKRKKRSVFV